MRSVALLAFIALIAPPCAFAQSALHREMDRRLSATYLRCSEAAGGYTAQILGCISDETGRQDRALNRTYQRVMKRLSPFRRGKLRGLERAWIARHQSECFRLSGGKYGGTAGSIDYAGCILDETVKRTIWLERYLG